MQTRLKWLMCWGLVVVVGTVVTGIPVRAQDAETETDPKDVADKLLRWTSLEEAFLKAIRNRALLTQAISQTNQKIEASEDDEEKKELRKQLGDARKQLARLHLAMEVVFGVGNRRTYEYNPVKSTVYLRVGTLPEAFARSVRARDALRNYVAEQSEKRDAEEDEEAKKKIEEDLAAAVRKYQIVAASLQTIFGVAPQRHYTYDPRNSTLYLNVSDNEVEKLRSEIAELQEEQDEAGETADKE